MLPTGWLFMVACPVYSVIVRPDGMIIYRGIIYVATKGLLHSGLAREMVIVFVKPC